MSPSLPEEAIGEAHAYVGELSPFLQLQLRPSVPFFDTSVRIRTDWGFFHSQGTTYMGKNLSDSVHNGSVPVSRLDVRLLFSLRRAFALRPLILLVLSSPQDMATRILAGWYLLEQDKDDFPGSYLRRVYASRFFPPSQLRSLSPPALTSSSSPSLSFSGELRLLQL